MCADLTFVYLHNLYFFLYELCNFDKDVWLEAAHVRIESKFCLRQGLVGQDTPNGWIAEPLCTGRYGVKYDCVIRVDVISVRNVDEFWLHFLKYSSNGVHQCAHRLGVEPCRWKFQIYRPLDAIAIGYTIDLILTPLNSIRRKSKLFQNVSYDKPVDSVSQFYVSKHCPSAAERFIVRMWSNDEYRAHCR